jgi:transposase
MAQHSIEVKRLVVLAYREKQSGSYAETAALFGMGEATVNRTLRRQRETGDVLPKPRPKNNPRRVDLDWLRKQLVDEPDARLIDRVEAWERHAGIRVGKSTMHDAVHACGWSYKKRRPSPPSATARR